MKIAVVIPTYKRIKKLERCLESLEYQNYHNFNVYIYSDNNDMTTYNHFSNNPSLLRKFSCIKRISTNNRQEFVIGSWNKFFEHDSYKYDAVAWVVDDVELEPNYLRELAQTMESNFPDLDGVVGAKQVCPGRDDYTFKWFGQVLLGRKFIERYKEVDYKVCCPFYKHFFQDEEMWIYANSLGKFVNCESAVLKHYHPAFVPEELDETHNLIRDEVKRHDQAVHEMRKNKNLVWGQTWQEK